MSSNNGNEEEKHEGGPHGPNCHCNDPEFAKAAEGMAVVLAELLPNLMQAWEAEMPGVTIDIRFDKNSEKFQGIAVRAKVLEDLDWPGVPDIDAMVEDASDADADGFMHWKENRPDVPPPSSGNGGKGAVH